MALAMQGILEEHAQYELLQEEVAWLCNIFTPQGFLRATTGDPPVATDIQPLDHNEGN